MVRLHAIHATHVKVLDRLLDLLADVVIQHAGTHQTNSHVGCRVRRLDHICSATRHWVLGTGAHHDGLTEHSRVAVDLCTKLKLDHIAVLQLRLGSFITRKRRIVAHHMVDRHSGRECQALAHLLVLEHSRRALLHSLVTQLHQLEHRLAFLRSIDAVSYTHLRAHET